MIELVRGLDRWEETKPLFLEYTQMLVTMNPAFAAYLTIQHYDDELTHPERKYGEPGGRLWLALADGESAGTIALRRLDDTRCEMKRLYVPPRFRHRGIGGVMIERIFQDAREIGYKHMLLDTLPPLTDAIAMYRARGFYDVPCYNDSPVERTIFLQKDL